jgi:hypothetical protein
MRPSAFDTARRASGALVFAVACNACPGTGGPKVDAAPQSAEPALGDVAEVIFDGGFKGTWRESGTAIHQTTTGGPATVKFDLSSEWILTRPGLEGHFGGLQFLVKEPLGEGEFLEVRVGSDGPHKFRAVKLKPDHRTEMTDGWTLVFVPMSELDPDGAPFDRIVFHPFRPFEGEPVIFDRIALAKGGAAALAESNGAAPPSASPARPVSARIACDGKAQKISPYIYGSSFGDASWSRLGITVHRWGGNVMSRYNWQIAAGNTASDWFFENHQQSPSFAQYLADDTAHKVMTAVTVPTLGWVAKDGSSYSFPVSVFGPQAKTDPQNGDIGNGVNPSGGNITPGPQARTSVEAPPDFVKKWVEALHAADAKNPQHEIFEYILDNEPMLWNSTHRDVHPDPLGYDELLDRTIRYGTAVREAAPDALIAGPAEWGWPAYFYSAKDGGSPNKRNPDRAAHGDVPLIEWYLRKLSEYERTSKVRVLDLLDVHYYPQNNLFGNSSNDPTSQKLRLRATRSLWDPTYVDESWINDKIRLLPRMHEWIDKNYPGLGISIGEWNFGGEKDVSGALATAETLGRFAQFGVTSAFYWTTPAEGTTTTAAFLAYRNFDGNGGHFLDWYVPTTSAEPGVSFFASRDAAGTHAVVVAVNLTAESPVTATLDFDACGAVTAESSYVYSQGAPVLIAGERSAAPAVRATLPAWSITVFDVALQPKPGAAH